MPGVVLCSCPLVLVCAVLGLCCLFQLWVTGAWIRFASCLAFSWCRMCEVLCGLFPYFAAAMVTFDGTA
jgi:hypothetical protein